MYVDTETKADRDKGIDECSGNIPIALCPRIGILGSRQHILNGKGFFYIKVSAEIHKKAPEKEYFL